MENDLPTGPFSYDAELFRRVVQLDKRGKCAMKRIGALLPQDRHTSSTEKPQRSSEITAQLAQTSSRMVERIRYILTHGTQEVLDQVKNGQVSVAAAYRAIYQSRTIIEKRQPDISTADRNLLADLLIFCRSPIPVDGYSRTWSTEEGRLMMRLVIHLKELGWLSSGEYKALNYLLQRYETPDFGGALNGKPANPGKYHD